jgi:ubiquinone/menaquinone biosynthesis C-methylase UbiE
MLSSQGMLALVALLGAWGRPCPCAGQDRDAWQQPERVMDVIGVRAGMTVGEVGAGSGYFTFKLAERVRDHGLVYANDIDGEALEGIETRCRTQGISNVRTILGQVADPGFPEGSLDLAFMSFVFHMLEEPVLLLERLRPALKPGAHLVILDRKGTGGAMAHAQGRMSQVPPEDQVVSLAERAGFDLVRIETFLDRADIYVFGFSG